MHPSDRVSSNTWTHHEIEFDPDWLLGYTRDDGFKDVCLVSGSDHLTSADLNINTIRSVIETFLHTMSL